ncbi:MAG: TIGR01212 family radical SAM protein [Desulfarculus sp.]|nr:TIGR01212 family radical SAM protein [Desulfarculus sp.]
MDASLLAERITLLGPVLRARFGGPVAKIGREAGLGCPNRDGTLGRGGCAYCPPRASGRGQGRSSITQQLEQGLERLASRAARAGRDMPRLLAYFQAHTSTHAPAGRLAPLFEEARAFPGLAGLVVSTRPDCLDPPRWDLLSHLAERLPLWLELGLQSAHEPTLAAINRGHGLACFDAAVAQARARGIEVVAHIILGLPGEGLEQTNSTARHLAGLGLWGVKMHNLMVLEGAPLAANFAAGGFTPWGLEQWAEAAAHFLARLPRQTVIHRLVADPGPERLLAPDWAAHKDLALKALAGYMLEHDLRQGDSCQNTP